MPRVLLVDDTPTDQKLIGGWLEKKGGYEVAVAADGRAALEWLRENDADLVLTDMQMPQMNGLELVTAVRNEFRSLPVVLITAHGSEKLASQALQCGASSYVPKSRFQEMLLDTVHGILGLSRTEESYQKSFQRAILCEVHFVLDNDAASVPPLIETVQSIVHSMGICDATGQLQVGIALEQAVLNAMHHGNLEINKLPSDGSEDHASQLEARRKQSPYCDRRTFVQVRVTDEEARLTIRDEGSGFDVQALARLNISTSMVEPSGRGFVLMWALMDKVSFNQSGNQVTLVKLRERIAGETPDESALKPKTEVPQLDEVTGHFGKLIHRKTRKSIELTKQRMIMGREPDCDIVLDDSTVSRRHCLLFVYEGWWFVKSLRESNAVRVNHNIVTQSRISPGSTLSLGDQSFVLEYDLTDLGAVGITPPVDPF